MCKSTLIYIMCIIHFPQNRLFNTIFLDKLFVI